MPTYPYQSLKLLVVHAIPVRPHDPYHIYIGFFIYLLSVQLSKRKLSSLLCLAPGFALSVLMESLDLRDNYRSTGHGRWHDAIHGLVATNLLPVLFVLYLKLFKKSL